MTANPIDRSLHHYVQHSLDATLIGYWSPAADTYLIDYLNPPALALLGLAAPASYPVPLETVVPGASLPAALGEMSQSQLPVKGHLSGPAFDFDISALANRLVIRLTRPSTRLEPAIGRHSMTAAPAGLLVFESVRTAEGIEDFRLLYRSEAARHYAPGTRTAEVGMLLTELNPATKTSGLFHQFVRVVETGAFLATEQESGYLNQALQMAVSRLDDGIIISINNSTGSQNSLDPARQKAAQLQAILRNSQDFIIVCESIRDAAGRIYDFKPVLYSQAVIDQGVLTEPMLRAYTVRQLLPDDPAAIDDYIRVVETGEPLRLERLFGRGGNRRWFDGRATKLDDGFLLVSQHIHPEKEAGTQLVEQAQLVEQILNSTVNPIYLAEAIRDEQGVICDFLIARCNDAGRQNMVRTIGRDGTGERLLSLYPFTRERGLFASYVAVVESGVAFDTEQYYAYDNIQDWQLVAARKVGDGVVVTYTDITGSRRIRQQVEEQAAFLNSVLNGSINGIMAFTAVRNEQAVIQDFTFIAVNAAACQISGLPPEDMIGQRLLTVFPGNRASGLMDRYVHTTLTGEPTRTRLHYPYDGKDFWLDVSAQQLGDGFVVTFTDVSEAQRIQQIVEQSATELRTIIDSAQVAIFLITPVWDEVSNEAERAIVDFRFRIANRKFADYVGQEPDALTGMPASVWFPMYRATGLFERYVTLFETGQTQHFDYHFNTQGYDVWLNVTASKLENDVLITFSDYTQLKELQHRLEASATELQAIINTSQTGIFLFAPVQNEAGEIVDFRFRLVNRQLAAYVGQPPETVVGGLGSQWFPDYQTNGLFEAYHRTCVTGEPQRFDFHYYGSGIDVWLDIMATKLGDDVLVTFGDYTPLKQLQQRLEASVVELRQSNANLEQFAYVASHDLQEPLRKIQSFGGILQTQYAPRLGAEGADLIGRMQSAAARMQILIKDVLAYSRIATKHDRRQPVELRQVVNDVLSDLETAIADKQAVVRVEPLPTVAGDAPQLRQLFQNLISNGLKFNRPAVVPTLTITTHAVQGRNAGMPVSQADTGRWFHLIEVTDNGIGFEPHYAERIFQVFQRLHGRSEYAGTGIGLAIVQKVVQNHQGYIVGEGRPGEGATFRMLLPAGENL